MWLTHEPLTIPCPAGQRSVTAQSESVLAEHPPGQQPSPPVHAEMDGYVHSAVHTAAVPESTFIVHASESSQLVGQLLGGSQVSPASRRLLPHIAAQSESVVLSQPDGQQPSPAAQLEIGVLLHAASHVAASPESESIVHASESSQSVGQLLGGSHVSPLSMTPLPQVTEQSLSVVLSQPAGQQASPPAQLTIAVRLHAKLHVSAAPVIESMVHAFESSQLDGQLLGGSHVSPLSTVPLPQVGEQSASVLLSHPAGQHSSPPVQLTTAA